MGQEKTTNEEILKINSHDFYFETPLYEIIEYTQLEDAKGFIKRDVDAYSAKNKIDTTYQLESEWVEQYQKEVENGAYIYRGLQLVTLTCKRKSDDELKFILLNDQISKSVLKIGQIPSISDLQYTYISRKFDRVLSKKYLSEFKKAIVCASHGYGVAAFVYLRRIFESLILETYEFHKDKFTEITDEQFKSKRMEEKIELLKSELPSQLIKMKSIYGILSLGIHSLDENNCMNYYPPLKLSIELILDQKIKVEEERKKDEEVNKQIQDITSKLKN